MVNIQTQAGPRIPVGEQEAFAWGFMVGYLGETDVFATDTMSRAFHGIGESNAITGIGDVPEFLGDHPEDATAYSRGYEAGVATYSDHAHPEDRT